MLMRQGDIFIAKIEQLPESARSRPLPHGTLVHGEVTGHSHRLEDLATGQVFSGSRFGELFIEVAKPKARIVHEEHGAIDLKPGVYRVWRQREYSPEAIRTVID